ncbi:hypothetical protein K435DRAFT_776181 [Dendrothele bispora CBS 962.96]|uniref:Uncharacterized protein n=1 Tax=Dendrothele bispora (strain CBS 962.96) TaxID=1314807 RepID=A0A4S8MET2_DENBC|nr:hypothetical protein K435DRAFT_776181 [Dendrothele bispora CBS 962.96]
MSQSQRGTIYGQHWIELDRVTREARVFIEHCHSFGAKKERALRCIGTGAVIRHRRSLEDAYDKFLNSIATFNFYESQQVVLNAQQYLQSAYMALHQSLTPNPRIVLGQSGMPIYTSYPLEFDQPVNSGPTGFFSNAANIGLDGSTIKNIRGNHTQSLNNSGMQVLGNIYNIFPSSWR